MNDYIVMQYFKNIIIFIGIIILLSILGREIMIEEKARFYFRVKKRMEQLEEKEKKRLNK